MGRNNISGCIKFSTFPWLPLTPTDRHVMSSTENSLHSGDQTMVISACEFLSDVVFLDFPAEVFLQRPSIVKILLQLLQVPSEGGTSGVVTAAVKTLRDLCVHLQHRIHFYQDPTLYTPKIDFGASPPSSVASPSNQTLNSSDTRPSVIGRSDTRNQGDGQDRDTSPSDSSRPVSPQEDQDMGNHQQEDTDVDEMDALQFSQLTLPQCCLRTLTRAAPLLRTDRKDTLVDVALLMDESLDVLGLSLTGQVWTDGSITARDMVEKLQEFLQILGEVSSYHHHQSGTSGDKEQHRLGFLVVSVFLHKFLKLLVPIEQAQSVISEHLSQSVSWIVFDEALSQSLPALRPAFLPYLEAVDGEGYQRFLQAETIVVSMQKTCQFLLNCQNRCDQDATELIQIAEDSLPSLPYHCNLTLVEEYVRLCSDVCSPVNASPLMMTNSRKVLLEVLAHSLVEVKLRAYSVCLALVKDTLHIDGPCKPSSCQKILFLLDRHVLYEICCFGMDDANERVLGVAQQVVLYLLQSQLLMPDHIWSRLMQIVAAIMPILQGYAGLQSPLGSSIRSLCEVTPSPVKGTLPKLERFRGVLRMMFSKDVRTRAEALSKLAWFLSDEEDSEKKLPVFTELDVAGLSDLYVIREPRYLEDSDEAGRSVFQVDSMMKVVNILRSPSVDIGVKKSALDQLAIMLQDTSLHKVFREEGGLEMVLDSMKTAVLKENSTAQFSETIFLPACVTLLRHLVHSDYHLRHQLAHESQTYYMIVRASILHNKNEQVHYDVSHLLLLLLFDEVASIDVWSVAVDSSPKKSVQCFSLPAFMAHRYHLPFKPITHHVISQHRIDLVSSTDPLQTGPPAEMLKIAWNVAWHGDMESLMVDLRKKKEEEKETEFSAKLHLTPADRAILVTTHLISAIQQCLYSMCNATSHTEVSQALGRLKTYMTVYRVHGLGAEILYRLKWREAIGRFLQVIPASSLDESLLMEILSFLNLMLEAGPVPRAEQVWLGDLLVKKKGALPNMISLQDGRQQDGEGDHVDDITRLLRKEVLCFVRRFVNRLPQMIAKTSLKTWLRGDIVRSLLLRLNLADAPQFYNLPSLESTLPCLTNVTARPGWSSGCKDTDSSTLCLQLLNCLLEVLSAFHIGRGGMSMSYMGRGVTRNATLCLRHLAYEMSDQSTEEDWPKCWLFTKQLPEHPSTDPAYNWLIPLWTYRDPEVRAAGLGIAVALTSTEAGRITMTTHCQQLIGGVWGAAFSVLLDHYECSMVRQQAALLLVNLTSDTMPSGSVELGANIWQGPVITSPQNQVALVGTSALMALLHHSHFYQEMVVLLSSYYPYITVHPIKVASNSPGQVSTASQSTLTTSESGTPVPGVATQFGRPAAHAVVVEQAYSSPSQHSSHHDSPVTGSSGQPADSSSPSTYLSRGSAGDYQSIATPSLVSAVSQLLTNLVVLMPQDTLDCLKKEGLLRALVSLTDPDLLAVYTRDMQQSKTPSSSSSSSGSSEDEGMLRQLVILAGLVEMYTSILQLVTHCCELDAEVREEILQEAVILDGTLRLLGYNITDSLALLLEFCESEHSQAASSALMVLRNMCHHSANKPKILGNEKVVPCLLKYLETNLDVGDATVAMSALWALVYNNQKAKATLKNSNMLRKLQKAYSTVETKGCGSPWREQQQGYMEAILSTIEE
ncbi:rotatin-like [Lingula anatina]|uniref:Rotatin-like n=1 Tax=Lingula anatina TaxID=7574 RepID=A0A1S3K5M3_LINAN|nr:rotatin-like [Lingula anatina]|eukprot:XP_013417729.1 rotatin-like [Lingula anatina]